MKAKKSLIALLLVIAMLTASMPIALALSFNNGDKLNSWTLSNVQNKNITNNGDVTYSSFEFETAANQKQKVYAVEFNPLTGNYLPYVYSQYSGYGAVPLNSAKDAESKYGVNVVAGINASFFSMLTYSRNTYGGTNISDGKIIQGASEHTATNLVVFQSNGTTDILSSKVSYNLYCNGSEWFSGANTALSYINISPEDAASTKNGIYYFDTSCGNNTDVFAKGYQIVCEKEVNTEISVGGSLFGKVIEIRETDKGTPIEKNQFILYVKDGSGLVNTYVKNVKVGDRFQIDARETIEASKSKMNSASSAFVTYSYIIVQDSKNVTATNGLGEDFNIARAQRSALGIKADGSLVMLTGDGRKAAENVNGLTVYELADLLISMGCVTAVNLDGGGSTKLIVENENGELENAYTSGENRRDANVILVIERPAISQDLSDALDDAIASAEASLAAEDNSALREALDTAKAIKAAATSTPGDYTKAIMNFTSATSGLEALNSAIDKTKSIKFGVYSIEALENIWEKYNYALAVRVSSTSTAAQIIAATAALESALKLEGNAGVNVALNKPYTLLGLYLTNGVPNWPDTDNKEATDGTYGLNKYSDNAYFGLNINASDVGADKRMNIVVDLGENINLSRFAIHTITSTPEGIKSPKSITYYYSKDGANYTLMGTGKYLGSDDPDTVNNTYVNELELSVPVNARYVKYEIEAASNWVFISEIEAFQSSTQLDTAKAAYLTKLNSKISAGDAILFTSDVMKNLSVEEANIRWAQTVICEWDSDVKGYKIIKVKTPDGADGVIEDGQIAISVHSSEGGTGDPSVANRAYLVSAGSVGKYIEFYGIYVDTLVLLPSGYIVVKDKTEFDSAYNGIDNREEPEVPVEGPVISEGKVNLIPEMEYSLNGGGSGTATYEFEDGALIVKSDIDWPHIAGNYPDAITVPVEGTKIKIDFSVIDNGYTSILLYAGSQIFKIHHNVNAPSSNLDNGSGDLGTGDYSIEIDLKDLKAFDSSSDPLTGTKAIEADDNGYVTFTGIVVYSTNGATVKINKLELDAPGGEPEPGEESSDDISNDVSSDESITPDTSGIASSVIWMAFAIILLAAMAIVSRSVIRHR